MKLCTAEYSEWSIRNEEGVLEALQNKYIHLTRTAAVLPREFLLNAQQDILAFAFMHFVSVLSLSIRRAIAMNVFESQHGKLSLGNCNHFALFVCDKETLAKATRI